MIILITNCLATEEKQSLWFSQIQKWIEMFCCLLNGVVIERVSEILGCNSR